MKNIPEKKYSEYLWNREEKVSKKITGENIIDDGKRIELLYNGNGVVVDGSGANKKKIPKK